MQPIAKDAIEKYAITSTSKQLIEAMWLVGRRVTSRRGITRHDLAATTEKMVGANGGQIELQGAAFRNLTVADTTSIQMVYVEWNPSLPKIVQGTTCCAPKFPSTGNRTTNLPTSLAQLVCYRTTT